MKLTREIACIVFLMPIIFSCSRTRRIAKAKETLDSNFFEAAKYCGQKFPIRDTTMYLPGAERLDTVYQLAENYIPVECPPSDRDTVIMWKVRNQVRTVTKSRVDTIRVMQENTAAIRAAEIERDRAEQETIDRNHVIDKRTKWLWWLAIYAAGMTVYAFRKPIFSFLKTFV